VARKQPQDSVAAGLPELLALRTLRNGTAHDGLVSAVTPTAPRNAAVCVTAYRLKRG
jgi:hypothetical protein